jgi:hypothetical protein
VSRWFFGTLAVLLVGSGVLVVAARVLGRPGSRAAALVSVLSQWLAAYILWSFAGGLAHRQGYLEVFEPAVFGVLALVGGFWQYRSVVAGAREHARLVFLGGQLLWIVILMVQNGVVRVSP